MSDIDALLRPSFRTVRAYTSARSEESLQDGVYLDANEHPEGYEYAPGLNRYPDPEQRELRKLIAERKGLDSSQVFLGHGSDEAIDLLLRLFCEPGIDKILVMPPTYGMYSVSAAIHNIEVKEAALTKDFQIDTETLESELSSDPKITFICSPNNPSGNTMERSSIEGLLQKANGLVVVDEAYIDFSREQSLVMLLDAYPTLVILQTFSKAWGLAGIRLGCAYATSEIVQYLMRIKSPYNIGSHTQETARVALENVAEVNASVLQICRERERLSFELKKFSMVQKVYPSDANFLLVKFKDAKAVYESLRSNNIIVRRRWDLLHCENCLRISVGSISQNTALLECCVRLEQELK